MTLERFTEKGNRNRSRNQDPIISLRQSASIGINQPALDEFFEDANAAVFLFDETANLVGIDPVENKEDHPGAYTITRTESAASIAPAAFLREHDLVPENTTRYHPEWDEDQEIILINLDDSVGVYSPSDESSEENTNHQEDDDADNEKAIVKGGDEENEASNASQENNEKSEDEETDHEDTADHKDSDEDEQGGLDDW